MGSIPYRMYDVCKKSLECIGARRQNLSRPRVEKLGCAGSRQVMYRSSQLSSIAWILNEQARVFLGWAHAPISPAHGMGLLELLGNPNNTSL
jgi:hypothetical protein